MSKSLALQSGNGTQSATNDPARSVAGGTANGSTADNRTVTSSAGDTTAAVLPAPLHTLGAAAGGGLAGLGAVYLVASRLAGTLAAVAAVVMIFAVTMAGPWVHGRAGTELGRVVAVALQAVAFGGAIGALALVL